MQQWLLIIQTLAGLIPAVIGGPNGQKVQALITELAQFGQFVSAGLVPPRDLPSIVEDVTLLVNSLPADAQALIPNFAQVQADVAKFATWLADLENGQVVTVSKVPAPLPGAPLMLVMVALVDGAFVQQNVYGTGQ